MAKIKTLMKYMRMKVLGVAILALFVSLVVVYLLTSGIKPQSNTAFSSTPTTIAKKAEDTKNLKTVFRLRDPELYGRISDWLTFSDLKLRIEFKYPKNWKVEKITADEYDSYIHIYKPDSKVYPWRSRDHTIPELNIGNYCFYSTSCALCANGGCKYVGEVDLKTKSKRGTTEVVTKLYYPDPDSLNVSREYYTFQFDIGAEGSSPLATPLFENLSDGQTVLDIISTLNYSGQNE